MTLPREPTPSRVWHKIFTFVDVLASVATARPGPARVFWIPRPFFPQLNRRCFAMADVVVTLEHFNTHIDALSRRLDRLGLLFSRFMEDTEATTRRISRELDALCDRCFDLERKVR